MATPPLKQVFEAPAGVKQFKKGDRVRLKIFDPAKDTGIKGAPQHQPDQQGTVERQYPGNGLVEVIWDGDEAMGPFEEDPDDLQIVSSDGSGDVEDF